MDPNASLLFLPWIRLGLSAMPTVGTAAGRRTVRVDLDVVNRAGDLLAPFPRTVALKGPGDVLGFGPRMIARVSPRDGENGAETTDFPFVEFVDPDFPWRYSPGSGDDGKLLP